MVTGPGGGKWDVGTLAPVRASEHPSAPGRPWNGGPVDLPYGMYDYDRYETHDALIGHQPEAVKGLVGFGREDERRIMGNNLKSLLGR